MRRIATVIAAVIGIAACGVVHKEDTLRGRATYDLQCPNEQIEVTSLGDRKQAGVEGCGKRATYVYGAGDAWILNTMNDPKAADSTKENAQPSATKTNPDSSEHAEDTTGSSKGGTP